jgi:hypothetical protein
MLLFLIAQLSLAVGTKVYGVTELEIEVDDLGAEVQRLSLEVEVLHQETVALRAGDCGNVEDDAPPYGGEPGAPSVEEGP